MPLVILLHCVPVGVDTCGARGPKVMRTFPTFGSVQKRKVYLNVLRATESEMCASLKDPLRSGFEQRGSKLEVWNPGFSPKTLWPRSSLQLKRINRPDPLSSHNPFIHGEEGAGVSGCPQTQPLAFTHHPPHQLPSSTSIHPAWFIW